jgi:hypothetical protein
MRWSRRVRTLATVGVLTVGLGLAAGPAGPSAAAPPAGPSAAAAPSRSPSTGPATGTGSA